MEYLKKELNDDSSSYKAAVPHPNKHLLLAISDLLKILTGHLQDHQTHPSTSMNLNTYLNTEADPKPHLFQKANNHTTKKSDTTLRVAAPLAYKALQHIIMKDYG